MLLKIKGVPWFLTSPISCLLICHALPIIHYCAFRKIRAIARPCHYYEQILQNILQYNSNIHLLDWLRLPPARSPKKNITEEPPDDCKQENNIPHLSGARRLPALVESSSGQRRSWNGWGGRPGDAGGVWQGA